MSDHEKRLNAGKDTVVIGDVSGNVGDGSVVIGPTDANGNVNLNQPMAVGRGAHAGPGSIAIGAGANAGSEIACVLVEIRKIIEQSNDVELIKASNSLVDLLKDPKQNKPKINQLWDTIKASSVLAGAIDLVDKFTSFICHVCS